MINRYVSLSIFCVAILWSCQEAQTTKEPIASADAKDSAANCGSPHSRAAALTKGSNANVELITLSNGSVVPATADTSNWPVKPWPHKMVWVAGGNFQMGGVGNEARPDEFPVHKVAVDGFWIDQTEVTNQAFKEFVQQKKFITTAETKPDGREPRCVHLR